ncbi:MAG TPA: hypothetical protein VKI18_10220 [Albitalea sp.]|nr:hypothetical protein [Albitalea sp.]
MASRTQQFTPSFQHPDGRRGFTGAARARLDAWWAGLPQPLRSPAWLRALAVLTVLFLLFAFHQVVRDAVRQGELLRMATANRSEAAWRCGALRGLRMRESCLAQLSAPPPEEPAPEARNVATLGR